MIDIGDNSRSKPASAVMLDDPPSQKSGLFIPGILQVQVYDLNLFSRDNRSDYALGRIFCIERNFLSQGRD